MRNDPLSHGLWEKTAPAAPPTEPLIGAVRADVVVVGCGYTGLSAALRLAEAGAKSQPSRRSRSASAARGAMSGWSTPECGFCRLT